MKKTSIQFNPLQLRLWSFLLILLWGQQSFGQTAPPTSNGTGSGFISNVTASTSGACVASTINGNNQFWDVAQGNTYNITLSNVTDCANGGTDATIEVIVKSSISGNTCVTANLASTGVYVFQYTLPTNACATFPIIYCTSGCSPSTGIFAQDLLQDGLGHLRTTYFDGNCNRTETDNDCENNCTFTTGITGDPIICAGESTQLCAGPGVEFSWSNGETSSCITVSDAGVYSVVAFDANGCSGSASVEVFVNTPPTVSIILNGLPSVCAPGCVSLSASGATSYVWSPTGETTPSISACTTDLYSVTGTDGNGCTGTSEPIQITINQPPVVEITPSQTGPVCDGVCVTLTASGAESYVWSPDGQTEDNIDACATGDYSVTGTDANGCTSASANYHVEVYPNPSCDIIEPNPFPVYGLPNNPLSATVDCPAGCNCTYTWGVTSSDNSWIITSGQGTPNIRYTCGNNGTTGHFTLTVTCTQTGCSSNCMLDVSSLAQEHCAYTQGFYGNTNGQASCLGLSAPQAVHQALNTPVCNPIVLGYGTRTLTFNCADAACITAKLPSGSTPSVLPSSATCSTATGNTWLANGRFKNVLVGQTLTLAINLRLFPNLCNLKITTTTFTTYEASACVNGNAVAGTGQTFTIPQSVINCLGTTNNKVCDLLTLANKKLGNQTTCSSVSLGDITAAVDAVNRGFDRCRVNSTNTIRVAMPEEASGAANLQMVAYPNPTNGDAVVEFVSNDANKAVIDIFNMNGSLAAHLFNDNVASNSTNRVNFSTGDLLPGIYFIRVTVGDESAYTRLVVLGH